MRPYFVWLSSNLPPVIAHNLERVHQDIIPSDHLVPVLRPYREWARASTERMDETENVARAAHVGEHERIVVLKERAGDQHCPLSPFPDATCGHRATAPTTRREIRMEDLQQAVAKIGPPTTVRLQRLAQALGASFAQSFGPEQALPVMPSPLPIIDSLASAVSAQPQRTIQQNLEDLRFTIRSDPCPACTVEIDVVDGDGYIFNV